MLTNILLRYEEQDLAKLKNCSAFSNTCTGCLFLLRLLQDLVIAYTAVCRLFYIASAWVRILKVMLTLLPDSVFFKDHHSKMMIFLLCVCEFYFLHAFI